jgi:hypothetical protein
MFIFSVLYERRIPSLSGICCPPCAAAAGACANAATGISIDAKTRLTTALIKGSLEKFREAATLSL